jgi:hypothetical protein
LQIYEVLYFWLWIQNCQCWQINFLGPYCVLFVYTING